MKYSIGCISKTWIYVYYDFSTDDIDGAIQLSISIRDEIGGEVRRVREDDDVFYINNDKFNLKFQWDSCFGFVVILEKVKDLDEVTKLLFKHFEKLDH